ncbi:hypothetical protein VNO78_22522 [Psophocarpus tetragonolobus]|uniref:Uncharacterized protein n=1 Tax=Psophocarpus tetragonolobus TaxID=3891 RepID=A0AAN9XC56_PSOTE
MHLSLSAEKKCLYLRTFLTQSMAFLFIEYFLVMASEVVARWWALNEVRSKDEGAQVGGGTKMRIVGGYGESQEEDEWWIFLIIHLKGRNFLFKIYPEHALQML